MFLGVVEGDLAAIEAYKSSGGDIARQLTADEVRLLNRPSAFDVGYTLVHLAIRFQRQDMLAILLTEVSFHVADMYLSGSLFLTETVSVLVHVQLCKHHSNLNADLQSRLEQVNGSN